MLSGILVLDKPKNISSGNYVRKLKKYLSKEKVGHAGTLDPMATGILIACVGQMTRFSDYLACLLYTSPSPRDLSTSRMPSSA